MRSCSVLALVLVLLCSTECGSGAADAGVGPGGLDANSEAGDALADGMGVDGDDSTVDGGGPGDTGSGSDATGADATQGVSDAAADGPGSCPATQPNDRSPCGGGASCTYGHTMCCGVSYSAFTCKCQAGGFSCAMTVECNFVCQDAGD